MSVEESLNKVTEGLKECTAELRSSSSGSSRFLSFFTVLLILTLDASNGKDLLDVVIPYIESVTK